MFFVQQDLDWPTWFNLCYRKQNLFESCDIVCLRYADWNYALCVSDCKALNEGKMPFTFKGTYDSIMDLIS